MNSKTTTKTATSPKKPRDPKTKATPAHTAPHPAPADAAPQTPKTAPTPDTSPDVAPPRDLHMADLADAFIAHLERSGKSRGTVFGYGLDIAMAVRHFGDKTKVSALTPRKVAAYFESDLVCKKRNGTPKAAPTIAKTCRVLRIALTFAAAEGLIPTVPLHPKPKRAKNPTPAA